MKHPAITKSLNYLACKNGRTVWVRAFRLWQRRPHEVAPLSIATHVCASCATPFTGNFCPRCGQSAAVGRFSFKKALLLFLDVWGIGNRSMFRSVRDLMLRPGYMIRDYLSGMQSAYFPPFKMFFLLTALSLLVEHGISLQTDDDVAVAAQSVSPPAANVDTDGGKAYWTKKMLRAADAFSDKYPAVFALMILIISSTPLYLFMRRSPTIPNLRYSELVVALVYTSNTYSIYSIIGRISGFRIFSLVALMMIVVTLKQFSGYSKKSLMLYIVLTFLIILSVLLALAILGKLFLLS